jgi:hypothetical protein
MDAVGCNIVNDTHDMLARGIGVEPIQPRLPSHRNDMAAMQAAGFLVRDCGPYIEVNTAAWKIFDRGFDTICPGSHPDDPNCRAYPLADGGWNINRYGTRAEQEKPGWSNNSNGFAMYRLPGPKTVIDISSTGEKEIADQTDQALTRVGIYQRAGVLCEIRRNAVPPPHVTRDPDDPTIVPLPKSAIREAIATAVDFRKYDQKRKKLVACPQPGWLAENMANRGRYRVPAIEGIVTVPVFLPDGSILTTPGYHKNTGLYYEPNIEYGDVIGVQEAIASIDDVLADFPFAKPAHKSAVYAAILTLQARYAIRGRSPMFLVEGNRAGVGKGLLIDVFGMIGMGSQLARMTATDSEDEMRKRLTSIFMSGEPAILLDNLSGKLKSAVLDAALTSETWSDRLLGLNATVRVPVKTVVLATGNNLQLHADTCRRTCHIRLETQLEHPEKRDDCKHQPLLPYVQQNRGKLTMAALSLLRHYHLAGRPVQGLKPWGSFEGWTLIRNVIVWAGMPDPIETLDDLQAANDTDTPLLRMLLDGWLEAGGSLTVSEAINLADSIDGGNFKFPALRAAIDEFDGKNKKQAIGIALHKYLGCRLDGRYFEQNGKKVKKWVVA